MSNVELTPEELALIKPFFEACDEDMKYVHALLERAKAIVLNRVISIRTAGDLKPVQTSEPPQKNAVN